MIFLFLNLGGGEIMVVLLFVLLFFGSKSIPDLARGLGKGLREIREASENIKREIEKGVNDVSNTDSPKKASDGMTELIKEHKEEVQAQKSSSLPLDQQTEEELNK
jgi:sec-independent protein translocase protein TatA